MCNALKGCLQTHHPCSLPANAKAGVILKSPPGVIEDTLLGIFLITLCCLAIEFKIAKLNSAVIVIRKMIRCLFQKKYCP